MSNKFNFFDFEKNFEKLSEDDSRDLESIGNYTTEELKNSIASSDSDKLCQIIVAYRYLNFNEELAICAMKELGERRAAGDNFNFESVIESSLAELPPLNFNLPDLRNLISQFSGKK